MLSPGFEERCSSSDRNRSPKRSSTNSRSASSRSTRASRGFSSATEECGRFRTVSFGIKHRVKVAHGSSASQFRESFSRNICNLLKINQKLWVIEVDNYRINQSSGLYRKTMPSTLASVRRRCNLPNSICATIFSSTLLPRLCRPDST